MSRRYKKKPVVIEANQWFKNGDHPLDGVGEEATSPLGEKYTRAEGEVVRYYRHPNSPGSAVHTCGHTWHEHGWIDTLEGGHNVCPGDWIITGVKGEHYPCKPDIFQETYEEVEPPHGS